ncbi:MAG: hypothetical protein U0R81_13615 [Mycobacterium sp.]
MSPGQLWHRERPLFEGASRRVRMNNLVYQVSYLTVSVSERPRSRNVAAKVIVAGPEVKGPRNVCGPAVHLDALEFRIRLTDVKLRSAIEDFVVWLDQRNSSDELRIT